MNLNEYLPVILFILVGIAVGVIPQVLGYVLAPHKPDGENPTSAASRPSKTRG
jgi:NADH-quinone oxidoreductase subunit A